MSVAEESLARRSVWPTPTTASAVGSGVGVDVDNVAALATNRRAGAQEEAAYVVPSWDFTKS